MQEEQREQKELTQLEEIITDVENKKFSEFSKKVKISLEDKLRDNPIINKKAEELSRLQSMKDTFASIETNSETNSED